jgi:hypothetical protein
MATVYKAVKGKPIAKWLAQHDGVQGALEERTFEIGVRAEEMLLEHRFEGHATIEVDQGKVDWYVTLSDDRGQKAAMSIEYGRAPTTVERQINGQTVEVEVGGMDGLFILHRAAHLPKKRRARVRV